MLESRNPATGELIDTVPVTSPRTVARIADEVARVQQGWALVPAVERADVLREAAHLMIRRRDELTELITAESGKTLMDASTIEVTGMILICDWLAGWAPRILAP